MEFDRVVNVNQSIQEIGDSLPYDEIDHNLIKTKYVKIMEN